MSDVDTVEFDAVGSQSLAADKLRSLHEQIQLKHYVDLPIRRFGDAVLVRYRAAIDKDIAEIIKHKVAGGDIKQALDANVDLLIRSCLGIYLNEDGQLTKVMDGSTPVTFANAGPVLGIESKSARENLIALFGGDEDASMAIHAQAQDFIEWSENRQGEIKEEFAKN